MAEWLKASAEIPDDPELEVDLCGLQYGYSSKSQIQLEKKEDMKALNSFRKLHGLRSLKGLKLVKREPEL